MSNCPKCNKPKEMYYTEWCPRCEPPKVETHNTINLIKCLNHLEAIGHEGIKDLIWESAIDYIHNDSYTTICFPEPNDGYYDKKTLEAFGVLRKFLEDSGCDENILFEVSW
jgi:hypothetical protein